MWGLRWGIRVCDPGLLAAIAAGSVDAAIDKTACIGAGMVLRVFPLLTAAMPPYAAFDVYVCDRTGRWRFNLQAARAARAARQSSLISDEPARWKLRANSAREPVGQVARFIWASTTEGSTAVGESI